MTNMDAFQLLDHNCWREVFRKLDAIDHLSCRLVCTSFYDLLEENEFQVKWKFHLALPLLFPYLKSAPDHWGRISWKDLYNTRLACQSWRQSVDKHSSEISTESISQSWSFPLITTIRSSVQIEDFHQRFGEYNGNPFPTRTVYLTNWNSRDDTQLPTYIQTLRNFAERFGRDIHKLKLYFSLRNYYTGYLFMCRFIQSISAHLPNLKTLIISGYEYNYYGNALPPRDQPEEMAAWIEENELPDLPNLQKLEVNGMNEEVKNYLVDKYGSQLTYFQRRFDQNPQIPIQLNPQQFPNLRKLSLDIRNHLDTLEALRFLESPLQTLRLLVSTRYPHDEDELLYWNIDEVLRNLKHLPLDCLKIRLHHCVTLAEGNLPRVDYMNGSIQNLSIHFIYRDEFTEGKISFNFLQALTNLTKLKLKFKTGQGRITHPEDFPEEVNLLNNLEADTPYESNVWEQVPSLRRLIVTENFLPDWDNDRERRIYTREQYEIEENMNENV